MGAELRRYGKPHCSLRQGWERAEHFGGWQRCGAGELCEPHLPLPMTLQANHLRFFTSNHSRPVAATTNTATTDQGVDEGVSSLGVDVGAVERPFFGADCTA